MVTRVRWLIGAAMVAACMPGPFDELGARCSIERPCSAPLFCVAGLCSATPARDGGQDAGSDAGSDAGVDAGVEDAGSDGGFPLNVNLLRNPGFEQTLADGGVVFWAANGGTLSAARQPLAGTYAARMTKTGGANPTLASSAVTGETTFGMLFCARASIRHFDDSFVVNLVIRERFADGGVNASNGGGGRIDAGAWEPIAESLVTFGSGNAVDLRITTGAMPPDASVYVDEVSLVRAVGTNCP